MPKMNAASKVLGLPELVEMILLAFPPKDLLRIRSFSRSFYTTIQSSTHFQRRLFFQQDPTPSAQQNQPPEINPFIRTALRRFAKVSTETFIHDFCEFQNCRPPIRHVTKFCVSVNVKEYSASILRNLEIEFVVWPPSWKDMHLTTRPCDVAVETKPWGRNDERLPPDAKMSDLVELMQKLSRDGLIGQWIDRF